MEIMVSCSLCPAHSSTRDSCSFRPAVVVRINPKLRGFEKFGLFPMLKTIAILFIFRIVYKKINETYPNL